MPIIETGFGVAVPIDGFGHGFFRVAGQVHRGPMLMRASGPQAWGGYDDLAPLLALAGQVDVLFIGTGAEIAPLPRALRQAIEGAGLAVEPMASPSAARSYNVLLAEGRLVAAALLPVPEPEANPAPEARPAPEAQP